MRVTRVVVGLGNPGTRYAAHRHNVGFLVVAELARRRGIALADGGDWAAATDPHAGLALVQPRTFMNRSGEALAAWARQSGVALTGSPPAPDAPEAADRDGPVAVRPLVVCDDLALPLGSLRLRERGSSGGQNGLASVIQHLGGEEFPRLRLGIAPLAGDVAPADWADFVLRPFAAGEREAASDLVRRAADAVACCLDEGLEAAAGRFNRRVRRSPSGPADPAAG